MNEARFGEVRSPRIVKSRTNCPKCRVASGVRGIGVSSRRDELPSWLVFPRLDGVCSRWDSIRMLTRSAFDEQVGVLRFQRNELSIPLGQRRDGQMGVACNGGREDRAVRDV